MLARTPALAACWAAVGGGQRCRVARLASRQSARAAASEAATPLPGRPLPRAVRPTRLKLVYVAKPDATADALAAEWAAKLRRYAPLEEVAVRPNPGKAAAPEAAVAAEGARVLRALGPSDVVVALDERGREATSAGIADLLAAAGGAGTGKRGRGGRGWGWGWGRGRSCRALNLNHRSPPHGHALTPSSLAGASAALEVRGAAAALVFLIGGPHGHAPPVAARADATLRLSGCVLNHTLARVVLLEQLYRGWTILRGEPYHH